MTRQVQSLSYDLFSKIVDQLKPFSSQDWNRWVDFVESVYKIVPNDMSENHFFLYIIPKVIQLHGYGDPLLDVNMSDYVRLLKNRGFSSYFSCNPSNIDMKQTELMLEAGLDYIKYSIENIDDEKHKEIRGEESDFSSSYAKINEIIDIKNSKNYKTTIIITMLDLNRQFQKEDFDALIKKFEHRDVYLYLKSEDQQWYRKDFHGTQSTHWSEFCRHPWMSMTVKSDGMAAMCMEDCNNEILLGDTKTQALSEIWNGELYNKFRHDHFELKRNIKCHLECDMKIIGNYL